MNEGFSLLLIVQLIEEVLYKTSVLELCFGSGENEGRIIREPSLQKDTTTTRGMSLTGICRSLLTYAQGELDAARTKRDFHQSLLAVHQTFQLRLSFSWISSWTSSSMSQETAAMRLSAAP